MSQIDARFSSYLDAAARYSGSRASETRFKYVVWCLWVEDGRVEAPLGQTEFCGRYDTFVAEFDWEPPPGTPHWIDRKLVDETLSVWQPYYEEQLTIEEAVEMVDRVGRLGMVLMELDRKHRDSE